MKNPYITDRPLTAEDMFFGRDDDLARVVDAFGAGQRLLLLFGLPRIGKTSFVNQLEPLLAARHSVLRVEQSAEEEPSSPLWFLLGALAEATGGPAPDAAAMRQRSREYVADYLHGLAARLPLPPLLCVDAVSALALGPGSPWSRDLTFLQDVLDEIGSLTLLIVVRGLPAEALNPGLEDIPYLVLPPLNEEETRSLLMVPVRGALAYDLDVAAQVHRLSGGSPYWAQRFGSIIFERREASGWVGKSEADDVLPLVLEQSAGALTAEWQRCSAPEKMVLSAMAEMWGFHGVASPSDVATYLGKLRVRMPMADIQGALDTLCRRGVMQELGGNTYRIAQQVFGRWIKEHTTTLGTLRETRQYRRARPPRPSRLNGRRVDWVGLGLWVLAGALVFAIAYVWQSRQRQETWGLGGSPVTEAQAPGRGPTPALPPVAPGAVPGRLVFQVMPAGASAWDIYTMQADGTGRAPLVEGEADDITPVWSPDGQRVAFVSDRDDNREIYVVGADGTGLQNLTNNAADDWTPAWSPDGQYLAFSSFRDGNWEIYIMGADGSNPQRLTKNDAADYDPAWSPDGQRIAFVSDRDGNLEIYSMATDGSDQRRLTDHVATDQAPAWSPDGSQILWESYRDDNMEIYIADSEGRQPRNVTRDAYSDDRGGAWSPWGGHIVFYSNIEGGWTLLSLDLATGAKARLSTPPAVEMNPHWGP